MNAIRNALAAWAERRNEPFSKYEARYFREGARAKLFAMSGAITSSQNPYHSGPDGPSVREWAYQAGYDEI